MRNPKTSFFSKLKYFFFSRSRNWTLIDWTLEIHSLLGQVLRWFPFVAFNRQTIRLLRSSRSEVERWNQISNWLSEERSSQSLSVSRWFGQSHPRRFSRPGRKESSRVWTPCAQKWIFLSLDKSVSFIDEQKESECLSNRETKMNKKRCEGIGMNWDMFAEVKERSSRCS